MDVNGNSTADGARLLQWTCHGGTNQQWRFTTA
ncbi:RICIN domain-containing protein [Dactylosporangium sucinum]|nr:RICIN domain-containing protein [Dactylosporangium sucinum]